MEKSRNQRHDDFSENQVDLALVNNVKKKKRRVTNEEELGHMAYLMTNIIYIISNT
jgi:hypothetical protein